MDNSTKREIAERLKTVASETSQNKTAKRLGISSAILSNMVNGKWDNIADEKWILVKNQIGLVGWQFVETTGSKKLTSLLTMAQTQSLVMGLCGKAGAGKSSTYKKYSEENPNVFHLECASYWNRITLLQEICEQAGLDDVGTLPTLFRRVIKYMKTLESPIIILDQFDKSMDKVIDLFIDMQNALDGICAFWISGVGSLQSKMTVGLDYNKVGFNEAWSRMGRRFVSLPTISYKDVKAVATANGVQDLDVIKQIYKNCENDWRRVRRAVEKYNLIQRSNLQNG